jgi:8-oxo-dGTP pyrophosphatase MutT (NUDIX family)
MPDGIPGAREHVVRQAPMGLHLWTPGLPEEGEVRTGGERSADPSAFPPSAGSLAEARRHIEAALPGDADHEDNRRRMLAFVDDHADALERTCAEGHLTGSAMVVDPVGRRFLLMLHAKAGRWFQPGGHADGDGSLPRVAWREATEEAGIAGLRLVVPAVDLDVHLVGPPHGPHLHLDVRYLALAPARAVPVGNHESLDLRWVPVEGLADFGVDDGLVRLARSSLAVLDALG